MSTLQDNLNAIKLDKNTNLLPENLKAGVTCLGINGIMEAGIDTSDATATVDDITNGKTAYVNGEKITGELPEYNSSNQVTLTAITANNFIEDTSYVSASAEVSITPGILRSALGAKLRFQKSGLRSAIGLTADKIKAGETILGVTGTYEGSGESYKFVSLSALETGTSIIGFKVDLSSTPNYQIDYSDVSIVNSETDQGLMYVDAYSGSSKLEIIGLDVMGTGIDLGCYGTIYEFTKTDGNITGINIVANQTYYIFTSPLTIDYIQGTNLDLPIEAIVAK